MRLVTYKSGPEMRSAVVAEGQAFDTERLAAGAGMPSDVDWTSNRSVIAAGRDAWSRLSDAASAHRDGGSDAAVGDVDSLELGPPITDPEKIVCLGANYRDHAKEAGIPIPEVPMLFAKFRNSLVGHGQDIVLPQASDAVDYEAELAVVIGRTCKDVPADRAMDVVWGAMPLNDVSARDLQKQTSQWLAGKAIDTFAPCGPALVTADEFGDLQALDIEARVNGETVQASNTSQMIFSIAETVEFVSRLMTLEPGDIIATGTPAGVGQLRTPPLLLNDGDVVEVEIAGLGTLSNRVVDGPVAGAAPDARAGVAR